MCVVSLRMVKDYRVFAGAADFVRLIHQKHKGVRCSVSLRNAVDFVTRMYLEPAQLASAFGRFRKLAFSSCAVNPRSKIRVPFRTSWPFAESLGGLQKSHQTCCRSCCVLTRPSDHCRRDQMKMKSEETSTWCAAIVTNLFRDRSLVDQSHASR